MRGKRPLALALAATLLLAGASGCRPSDTSDVRALVIGDKLPRLADPASGKLTPADLVLAENAAQGLVRFDGAGNIVPGLAERWAVSNDGLSYVFRLRKAEWSDGRRVRARDIVRLLERQTASSSRNPLKDTLGAIRQIVAMTDRVVAIELNAPRPHLLQLLAQPEFSLIREGQGGGPFMIERKEDNLLLTRVLPGIEEEESAGEEQVSLGVATAEKAVAEFVAGKADLVLGGTSGDLAIALGARLPRGTLRVDPVAGLFGLVPARAEGAAADLEVRALLDAAINRQALVEALGVPQLQPRATLLQPGLDGAGAPHVPSWAGLAPEVRRAGLMEAGRRLFPVPETEEEATDAAPPPRTPIRIALPAGPGGAIILERLKADWEPLGHLSVVAAKPGEAVDFRWVDEVAPSSSRAWFLRSFRCDVAPVCLPEADRLLDAARLTGFAPQRSAFFTEVERQMREAVLFIPVAAPVRWSLAGRGLEGFTENRFARHPLSGLRERAGARN